MNCADTSFLLSYYGEDDNSEKARESLAAIPSPLRIHAFNDFELPNALRALRFRGLIFSDEMEDCLADYHADKRSGVLVRININANAALRRANMMSEKWTETSGNRSYDILLVAAAKHLDATHFWSFDKRQRRLAEAEGMKARP